MEVKEFFEKAKQICDESYCTNCPLRSYCPSASFANQDEIENFIEVVTTYQELKVRDEKNTSIKARR